MCPRGHILLFGCKTGARHKRIDDAGDLKKLNLLNIVNEAHLNTVYEEAMESAKYFYLSGQVRARPALLKDRAAQNHRAGARRSAQSLRVDVHGGLTTVSASRSFLAAAPPDPSSCARRGRWASADAAGPLHDPTGRAGLDCSSSKSKSARSAVTPGVSGVERAPAAGLHGTGMSTARCLAMWLS